MAFTILSLMLVAAVGVSAGSGKDGKSNEVKSSVVALFSHADQTSSHDATTEKKDGKGGEGNKGGECKAKKPDKHHHATEGHKHHPCGDDDSD